MTCFVGGFLPSNVFKMTYLPQCVFLTRIEHTMFRNIFNTVPLVLCVGETSVKSRVKSHCVVVLENRQSMGNKEQNDNLNTRSGYPLENMTNCYCYRVHQQNFHSGTTMLGSLSQRSLVERQSLCVSAANWKRFDKDGHDLLLLSSPIWPHRYRMSSHQEIDDWHLAGVL